MKMYGLCCFLFETLWKVFQFFAISSFLKNYSTDLKKKIVPVEKLAAFFDVTEYFASLLIQISRSTAFENFTKGIFGLFALNLFIFSNFSCANLR